MCIRDRQDTRKVVNLARIPGTISGWGIGDLVVEGFTSYSQLTLEQALWYRDKLISGNTSTYRVFYVGVFEQLQSESDVTDPSTGVDIDEYGRWQGEVIDQGEILEPERTEVTPGKKGPDPDMPPGIANPNLRGTGLAMVGAMDLDQSAALLAGIIGGAAWAIQQLINLGLRSDVDIQDAVTILQSNVSASDSLTMSSASVPPAGESDQQKAEREAADKKLADAEAQYGPDSDEAADARRERSDTLTRHKRERRSKTGSTSGDARRQREAEQEAAKKKKAEREARNREATMRRETEKIRRAKEQEKKGKQRTDEDEFRDLVKNEERKLLEDRKRILRETKQPYILPEIKKEKIKHRPKVNYSGKQRVVGDGLMKKAEVPTLSLIHI